MKNTHPAPVDAIERAFRQGLRPDPLPPAPAWMTDQQRGAWLLGAREGVALGRQLERQEQEAARHG